MSANAHKLSVLLNNLGASQPSLFTLKALNELSDDDYDVYGFYETLAQPCLQPKFFTSHIYDATGIGGVVIATDLSTASKLLNFTGTRLKYFYVWDFEWLRFPQKMFTQLRNVYAHKDLKLIARSEESKNVVEKCWNASVYTIMEDFNVEALKCLLENS